jgi:hypothetical protein
MDRIVRAGMFHGVILWLVVATQGYGVVASLKAVKVNDNVMTPTNEILAAPGDTIVAEVFWSGWEVDRPGVDARMRTIQATVDGRNSFFQDGVPMILPAGWDTPPIVLCTTGQDCEAQQPSTPTCSEDRGFCTRVCAEDADCIDAFSSDFPVCLPFLYCAGADHEPSAFSFVCTPGSDCSAPMGEPLPRPDFCLNGFAPLSAESVGNLDFSFGSTSLEASGPIDEGQTCYGATLTLVVQPEACGSTVINLKEDGGLTFVQLTDGAETTLHAAAVEGLTIHFPECPVFVPRIIHAEPENCLVDHRYPHPPGSQLPAFWFNPDFEFVLHFDGVPEVDGGVFALSDFSLTQTGAGGTPPSILPESFQQNGATVTFRLNRPAVGTRWTCIDYLPCVGSADECMACWARFPGDVNGDRIVDGADLNELINIVQDGNIPGSGTPPLTDCDMDRSGACAAPDIIGWIDLFNGADAFTPWGGQAQVACPSQQIGE